MTDRRKSGVWDRRVVSPGTTVGKGSHCKQCGFRYDRPDRRKDHAMREKFNAAFIKCKAGQPYNGYDCAMWAGLRAMYRELKGKQNVDETITSFRDLH